MQVLLRFEYLRTVLLAQAEDPPRLHAPAAPFGPASGVPGASGVADQATLDAVVVEALGLLDRLSAYVRLILMLRAWCRRSSLLRTQFQDVLGQIGDDIARGALPFWAALPLRALLPRQDRH